jgi:hypothetical protein
MIVVDEPSTRCSSCKLLDEAKCSWTALDRLERTHSCKSDDY